MHCSLRPPPFLCCNSHSACVWWWCVMVSMRCQAVCSGFDDPSSHHTARRLSVRPGADAFNALTAVCLCGVARVVRRRVRCTVACGSAVRRCGDALRCAVPLRVAFCRSLSARAMLLRCCAAAVRWCGGALICTVRRGGVGGAAAAVARCGGGVHGAALPLCCLSLCHAARDGCVWQAAGRSTGRGAAAGSARRRWRHSRRARCAARAAGQQQ